jgi:hypothetical protein
MNKRRSRPVIERLMEKVFIPADENGLADHSRCWIWQGAKNNAGYGMVRQDQEFGMRQVTHIVAEHNGIMSPNLEVQHTCLNKLCVNPAHLVMGTSQTRYDRMINQRGRWLINKRWEDKETMMKECPVCKGKSYVTWFSRQHKHCETPETLT